MKIAFFVNDLSGGNGWSTYALNIIHEAVSDGIEVHALVNHRSKDEIRGVTQYELLPPPHKLAWNPFYLLKTKSLIKSHLDTIAPDIVHVIAEPYVQLWGVLSQAKYKLILTLHGTYARLPLTVPRGFRRVISEYFFEKALKIVSSFISVSERTKRIFLAYAPYIDSAAVIVIHNSISTNGVGLDKALKSKSEPYHVLTLGAVKARKGIHTAIKILSEWAESRTQKVIYDVVGFLDNDSPYKQLIQELSEKHSSEYFTVILHGHVNEEKKKALLTNSSLYIHLEKVTDVTVEFEGFGISILEAASYGVPAIVANGSATAEAVKESHSGYVLDLTNTKAVYDNMDELLLKNHIKVEVVIEWAHEHSPIRIYREIKKVYEIEH